MSDQPLVVVLMGSDSDYEKLDGVFSVLKEFGIPHRARVLSAHRTPDEAHRFAASAEEEGVQVIICAAGLAAHLAGVMAAGTILPVIGIPVEGGPLKGMDALLSTVQMPSGVPVATVGIGNGMNAGLLAAQILARADPDLAAKLRAHKQALAEKVAEKDARLQDRIAQS